MKEKLQLALRLIKKNIFLLLLINFMVLIILISVFNKTNIYATNDEILCECDVVLEGENLTQNISRNASQINFNKQSTINISDLDISMTANSVLFFNISLVNLADRSCDVLIDIARYDLKNYKIELEMNNKVEEFEKLRVELPKQEILKLKFIISIEDVRCDAVLDGSIIIKIN